MSSYIAAGDRYYRISNSHRALVSSDSQNAFVSIVFSAMYIESVVNEVIFYDKLSARSHEEYFGKKVKSKNYKKSESFKSKVKFIFKHYGLKGYGHDDEYIELLYLIKLRNGLVHLNPVEQKRGGEPEKEICREALDYLHKKLKIIDNPFAIGVYWTDRLMNEQVADWAVATTVTGIKWMFDKTYDGKLGNRTLDWHCILTGNKT